MAKEDGNAAPACLVRCAVVPRTWSAANRPKDLQLSLRKIAEDCAHDDHLKWKGEKFPVVMDGRIVFAATEMERTTQIAAGSSNGTRQFGVSRAGAKEVVEEQAQTVVYDSSGQRGDYRFRKCDGTRSTLAQSEKGLHPRASLSVKSTKSCARIRINSGQPSACRQPGSGSLQGEADSIIAG